MQEQEDSLDSDGGCNLQFKANTFLSFKGLNMYLPLKFVCWNSNLQHEGLKQQGFGKVNPVSRALVGEVSTFPKEEQEALWSFPHERSQQEKAVFEEAGSLRPQDLPAPWSQIF